MSDIELTVTRCGTIERLLTERYGAVGKGLVEKAMSVGDRLSPTTLKHIKYIGWERNPIAHNERITLRDRNKFIQACDEVERELLANRSSQTANNYSPSHNSTNRASFSVRLNLPSWLLKFLKPKTAYEISNACPHCSHSQARIIGTLGLIRDLWNRFGKIWLWLVAAFLLLITFAISFSSNFGVKELWSHFQTCIVLFVAIASPYSILYLLFFWLRPNLRLRCYNCSKIFSSRSKLRFNYIMHQIISQTILLLGLPTLVILMIPFFHGWSLIIVLAGLFFSQKLLTLYQNLFRWLLSWYA